MCGGADTRDLEKLGGEGLSPRVRGSRFAKIPKVKQPRSIPACAGEPKSAYRSSTTHGVYPRVCGGSQRMTTGGINFDRSIPACAGEPRAAVRKLRRKKVYPRVCGGASGAPVPE